LRDSSRGPAFRVFCDPDLVCRLARLCVFRSHGCCAWRFCKVTLSPVFTGLTLLPAHLFYASFQVSLILVAFACTFLLLLLRDFSPPPPPPFHFFFKRRWFFLLDIICISPLQVPIFWSLGAHCVLPRTSLHPHLLTCPSPPPMRQPFPFPLLSPPSSSAYRSPHVGFFSRY